MNTLDKLGEILKIMNIANIELPEIQFFLKYHYEDNNGWGECIYGKATTIEVTVTKDDSNTYGLEQTGRDKLFDAPFPK